MEPTTTSMGGLAALKLAFIQALIASLAGLLGFVLIRPKTVREAVWRFFGAAVSSVVFGPMVVAVAHNAWPGLLVSANALAADDGIGFTALYFTAPIQIASGLPIWWLLGLGARWLEGNRDVTLEGVFDGLINALVRSRNAAHGEPGTVQLPPRKKDTGNDVD